ncbi:hypothetical protein RSOLAG22IIIB_13101 [Rhizoctonia solani]|uniref:Uncharacterized protein n=1 Tax=Rhizoctonia solani TaxID=456999 RepID=A0A0K6GID2_9AGAM|nr:hypothetical protein RSOLAG22IIIB_13101 [Rhizoctonia solani]
MFPFDRAVPLRTFGHKQSPIFRPVAGESSSVPLRRRDLLLAKGSSHSRCEGVRKYQWCIRLAYPCGVSTRNNVAPCEASSILQNPTYDPGRQNQGRLLWRRGRRGDRVLRRQYRCRSPLVVACEIENQRLLERPE